MLVSGLEFSDVFVYDVDDILKIWYEYNAVVLLIVSKSIRNTLFISCLKIPHSMILFQVEMEKE